MLSIFSYVCMSSGNLEERFSLPHMKTYSKALLIIQCDFDMNTYEESSEKSKFSNRASILFLSVACMVLHWFAIFRLLFAGIYKYLLSKPLSILLCIGILYHCLFHSVIFLNRIPEGSFEQFFTYNCDSLQGISFWNLQHIYSHRNVTYFIY